MTRLSIVGLAQADRATLDVVDGRVAGPASALPPADTVIDAAGLVVAPGYVDLQCNGGFGIDLAREPGRLWELAAALPRHGVTAFLPTLVSGPPAVVDEARAALAEPPSGFAGAAPLGLHLEGPALNPIRRGAHDAAHLRSPADVDTTRWDPDHGVVLVTLAPELPGALTVAAQLARRGVVVSAGHTEATLEELRAAADAGVTAVTHLFNAMPPLASRAPGTVGGALTDPRLTATLIADGVHVDPAAVAVALACLGSERLALVTDSVSLASGHDGTGTLGDGALRLVDGAVRDDSGRLAGSVLTMDAAVANLVRFTGCPPAVALACASASPARLLGLADKGLLLPGADGDVVLLDDALGVVGTVCAGRLVYAAPELPVRG